VLKFVPKVPNKIFFYEKQLVMDETGKTAMATPSPRVTNTLQAVNKINEG